jgi:hypothetical protein
MMIERPMLKDRQYCVVITSVLALLAFIFTMRFLPDLMDWTGWPMCSPDDCNVQGWLGALSGWFGGVAAFATILFVIRQIGEQKRQTDFSIGDAMPTMDAVEHLNDSSELVVRIVNWNRRAAIVRFLDVDHLDALVFPTMLTIDGVEKIIEKIEFGIPPFPIRGWEDRSKGPHCAEIRLAAYRQLGDKAGFQGDWREIPSIIAAVQILGDSHKLTSLRADTRPLLKD